MHKADMRGNRSSDAYENRYVNLSQLLPIAFKRMAKYSLTKKGRMNKSNLKHRPIFRL